MSSLPLSYQRLIEQDQRLTTDSRSILNEAVFFALKGPNFNGNQFALQALEQGAAFAVVDEKVGDDPRLIFVQDVLLELQSIARLHRSMMKSKVIAITGSNGKTTTKELAYSIFSKSQNVIATRGNLNNHIGVPLTLLQIRNDTDFALVEMGANKPGDIQELCSIAEPDAGLITSIGKAHLEGFGSPEGVLKTKMEMFQYLDKHRGTCFYNLNDEQLFQLFHQEARHIAFGDSGRSSAYSGEALHFYPDIELYFNCPAGRFKVHSKLFGKYNYHNILSACTLASYYEIPAEQIQAGIESYVPDNMRSQIIQLNGATVVLDAYNANPSSMREAIVAYSDMAYEEKWILLGEMAELGSYADKEHDDLVNYVKGLDFAQKIFMGTRFGKYAKDPSLKIFTDLGTCKSWLQEHWPENAAILIKGSRSSALEKLIR